MGLERWRRACAQADATAGLRAGEQRLASGEPTRPPAEPPRNQQARLTPRRCSACSASGAAASFISSVRVSRSVVADVGRARREQRLRALVGELRRRPATHQDRETRARARGGASRRSVSATARSAGCRRCTRRDSVRTSRHRAISAESIGAVADVEREAACRRGVAPSIRAPARRAPPSAASPSTRICVGPRPRRVHRRASSLSFKRLGGRLDHRELLVRLESPFDAIALGVAERGQHDRVVDGLRRRSPAVWRSRRSLASA